MLQSILPLLCCPVCHESLSFEGSARDERLISGTLKCLGCGRVYPIENEIPYLTDPEVSAHDWEWEVDIERSETFDAFDTAYLNSMPLIVRQNKPLLVGRIVELADRSAGPILDVATGRGMLLRELALLLKVDQPLLGMDIDVKVLRGTQRYLRRRGLYEGVSLAVMDAKHLALRSATIGIATSWFGYNNIPDAMDAMRETRRVLIAGGEFIVASLNVEPTSKTHHVAEEAGFADFLTREKVKASLDAAGLTFDRTETFVEGVWPGNAYDALPLKGDRYTHRLVIAHRPQGDYSKKIPRPDGVGSPGRG